MKQKEKNYQFQSGLAELIPAFLDEKHRLGYKYEREYFELMNLDRFSLDYDCKNCLPEELVLAWTKQQPHQSATTARSKINIARELAKFMSRNGFEAYLYPECMTPKQTHEHTPYIFTHEEIQRLFTTLDQMRPVVESPKKHIIFPLLFRLLYCCGLRISEALNLKVSDVDANNGVLMIRDAKAYTDRLIPMDDSLTERCMWYKQNILLTALPEQYFFPSTDGLSYHVFTIRLAFRNLLWKSGISYGGRLVGPRLHDIRHTFAVHSLQKAVTAGKDAQEVIPLLAVYLGHKTYKGTNRYLHLTAEMFPEILEQMETACGRLIPESAGAKND